MPANPPIMEPDPERPALPRSRNRWLPGGGAIEWHYVVGGERRGPVLSAGLKSLAEHGTLKPSDLVWTEGLPDWAAAGRLTGLFAAPAERQSAQETPEPARRGQPGTGGQHGNPADDPVLRRWNGRPAMPRPGQDRGNLV